MKSNSMEKSLVTVIIVTYKRHSEVLSCLAALEKQTCPVMEVIVVDNAPTSTEGSLKELISTLSFSFQIRYFVNEINSLTLARNIAVSTI